MTALIAVYHELSEAESVAGELTDVGIDPAHIRVAADGDALRSISAEMQAEVNASWGSPVAFLTGEMMRGVAVFMAIGAVVGAVVGVPIGLLLFNAVSSGWQQAGVGALIGVIFGAAVGTILGGGLAMKSPEDELAAEVGPTVVVDDADAAAEAIMASHHPIRLDVVLGSQLLGTPVTERSGGFAETIENFTRTVRDPSRQG